MQIKILATYNEREQAVGMGETEDEALEAVLCSSARFAEREHVSDLRESIKEVFAEASPDVLDAGFEYQHWSVVIHWCASEKGTW